MGVRHITLADEPRYIDDGVPDVEVWPEYNLHGDVTTRVWWRLTEDLPRFQFVLVDDATGELLAEAHTIPCWWDGRDEGLGPGIDATLDAAFERLDAGLEPNTLCAVAAEIPPRSRGRGLARVILETMGEIAADAGLAHLIAPVRPSWKDRYPITPIERYVTWRRDDGQLFDPWLRVHEALGARIGPCIPHSLRITGTVGEWETWTGMVFPETSEYVFPHGLAPVTIDRAADVGHYFEPNVWMIHG